VVKAIPGEALTFAFEKGASSFHGNSFKLLKVFQAMRAVIVVAPAI